MPQRARSYGVAPGAYADGAAPADAAAGAAAGAADAAAAAGDAARDARTLSPAHQAFRAAFLFRPSSAFGPFLRPPFFLIGRNAHFGNFPSCLLCRASTHRFWRGPTRASRPLSSRPPATLSAAMACHSTRASRSNGRARSFFMSFACCWRRPIVLLVPCRRRRRAGSLVARRLRARVRRVEAAGRGSLRSAARGHAERAGDGEDRGGDEGARETLAALETRFVGQGGTLVRRAGHVYWARGDV